MTSKRHENGMEAEFIVKKRLLEKHFQVSEPIRSDCPYDIVAGKGGTLVKIQVKHGYTRKQTKKKVYNYG
jgi:Holliday junction resolvase